jgi:hypothetical protein
MSLFDQASILITPNAVKEGKLFSIKPTDGSGDLSVVRATSATIPKNAQGLVEVPRTNLVLRSEEFDNAYWVKLAASISENSITSPNDTITADKLIEDTSGSAHRFISTSFSTLTGVSYTVSIFLKKAGRDYAYIRLNNSGGDIIAANINLLNGTVSQSIFGNITIVPYNNDWYRVIATGTSISTSNGNFEVRTSNSATYANYTGDGTSGIYIWGAQLEQGVTATEYIPTTSVIRTKFAGITQDGGSASNIARLDYTNSTCPSILVEPQRTNLALRSEEFDNVYYTKVNGNITPNVTTAPNGTLTADLFTKASAINTTSGVQFGASYTSTGTHTFSVFIKPNVGNLVLLRLDASGNSANFLFNFTTKIFTNTGANAISSSFDELPNGWFRLKVVGNVTSVLWVVSVLSLFQNPTNDSFFIWGAQLEAGSNATSYIPTVASAVTRNADVISKTGISDLIGQTEGTIFVDFNFTKATDVYRRIFAISDNTSNNLISINLTATGSAEIYIINGGVTQVAFVANTLTLNTRYKIAVGYIANNVVLYINGTLRNTDLSCTIPTCSGVYLGKVETAGSTGFLNDTINTAMLFKTKLTNSELETLTTL